MAYYRASTSFGSTGNKTLTLDLGGDTPIGVRITMGARLNTTETSEIFAIGGTDGTRVHCHAIAPGFSKKWPYSGESSYLIAHYSSSSTKVFSATYVSWAADELVINVDTANANYQLIVEAWS